MLEKLVELNKRIRCVRAQLKRETVEGDFAHLDARLETRLLMVYIFSGHDLHAAADFLLHRNVLVEAGLEARLHVMERVYLQTPTHQIVNLMNDSRLAVRNFYDMKVACRFVLQLKLFHWLEKQNCEHGVAPSRIQLIRFALSALPDEAPATVVQAVAKPLQGSSRRQRRWLQTFRQSWGARLGRLHVATTMSQAEMQEKAGREDICIQIDVSKLFSKRFQISFLGPDLGPYLGSKFGTPFWGTNSDRK